MGLPEVTEQDHHGFPSFRVANKIFATLPDPHHLHLMLNEPEVRMARDIGPDAFQELWWGQRLAGARVTLAAADPPFLADLMSLAWRRKAPRRLHPPGAKPA
jgi:hypothetical protein